jgi:hypothetical protein
VGVGAQHAGTRGVEGHDPHGADGPADEELDPLAHLVRGLVGEGDRQDLVGARLPRVDQVRDPVGEDARLARACARQHQERAVGVQDGLALGVVEALEEAVDEGV